MKTMKVAFCVALTAVMLCGTGWGQERPVKRLIEYGWDVPYPDSVQQNIREMEQKPFDGLIFRLRDFSHAFDTRPWQEAALEPQLDTLAGIKWGKFRDNFLCLYAANNWGMDWFNDEQWGTITVNMRLLSKAAKVGRCVGICFDQEPYGSDPWAYPGAYGDRSFAEVGAEVRKRGAQFISALQEELPNLRLLTFFQLSLFPDLVDEPDATRRSELLAERGYALLPAFLNGMLDATGAGVKIIDGNEPAYYYSSPEAYFRAYHLMKQKALTLVAPENRERYISHVQAGVALYMDYVLSLGVWAERATPTVQLTPEERLLWFEHNVYYALTSTDEYVWCYSEQMNWWENRVPEGAEEAIRSARTKMAAGEPLDFDIAETMAAAQRRIEEALAARLIQRRVVLRPLGPEEAVPKIDGLLDDAVWASHPALEPFLPVAISMKDEPECATVAWVTYDDGMLYVAFRCAEAEPGRLAIVGQRKDDEVYRGDDVEVLVSLGESPWPYVHFIVNPRNVQWDGQCLRAEINNARWDAQWQSATHIAESEWTAELAIPWDSLGGRPEAGSSRRANLCRMRGSSGELSVWSGMVQGFLEAQRFGVWEFSG